MYIQSPAAQAVNSFSTKCLTYLWKIRRRDGVMLFLTKLDRGITHEGDYYTPAVSTDVSQERAQAGLVESELEISGLIDGSVLRIVDLKAARYKGAEVVQRIVDWRYPWLTLVSSVMWVSQLRFDGIKFTAQLESRAARLQQPVGGYFGGIFKPECEANYGDHRCKKDISGETYANVPVTAVIDSKFVCEFDSSVWTGSFEDGYYRDGEVEWTTGDNVGIVSPVVYHTHSNRRLTFLFPTPFAIQVGDQGRIKPGCNGLVSTCISRNNILNFVGDPYSPGAGVVIDPPSNG